MKMYVVDTHLKRLGEALRMSTHNMILWRNKNSVRFDEKNTISGSIELDIFGMVFAR